VNQQPRFSSTLGVVGAPLHWKGPDGRIYSYEPYVREMHIWADLFSRVSVCAAAGEGGMQGNLAPYRRDNIDWLPVAYTMRFGAGGAFKRAIQLPGLVWNIWRTIFSCDVVLMRSPSHFGLVGAFLLRILPRPSVTKWAGENGAYIGERVPSRVNRWLEGIPRAKHCVLVYGPSKRPHQISFPPALMSGEELTAARAMSQGKSWRPPWRILSVGRLRPEKGFDLALRGLGELNRLRPDLEWQYTLIGDGFARQDLATLATTCKIADRVRFTGALSFQDVQQYYARSHVVIMPGTKEGWPKVIAEAWAHGAVPFAARGGVVPWILRDEKSGVVFEPSPASLANALSEFFTGSTHPVELSAGLYHHAEEVSLDVFRDLLTDVLVERCGLS